MPSIYATLVVALAATLCIAAPAPEPTRSCLKGRCHGGNPADYDVCMGKFQRLLGEWRTTAGHLDLADLYPQPKGIESPTSYWKCEGKTPTCTLEGKQHITYPGAWTDCTIRTPYEDNWRNTKKACQGALNDMIKEWNNARGGPGTYPQFDNTVFALVDSELKLVDGTCTLKYVKDWKDDSAHPDKYAQICGWHPESEGCPPIQ